MQRSDKRGPSDSQGEAKCRRTPYRSVNEDEAAESRARVNRGDPSDGGVDDDVEMVPQLPVAQVEVPSKSAKRANVQPDVHRLVVAVVPAVLRSAWSKAKVALPKRTHVLSDVQQRRAATLPLIMGLVQSDVGEALGEVLGANGLPDLQRCNAVVIRMILRLVRSEGKMEMVEAC
ncbi:hypothetical protein PHYPSEUDO_014204 [Phytophthora pseudosyringae]|uniref:Uncharacterized protein n=1 Tax=Phytophthora pseudosyringae TaxID=221518 RepID=A0A8T1V790_9STRA|nr:hypothetical protein PHYPSEUDO_014204 [Phytophthora pseudosyringae]